PCLNNGRRLVPTAFPARREIVLQRLPDQHLRVLPERGRLESLAVEQSAYRRSDQRHRVPREDERRLDSVRTEQTADLREVCELAWPRHIGQRRQQRTFHDRPEQHVR